MHAMQRCNDAGDLGDTGVPGHTIAPEKRAGRAWERGLAHDVVREALCEEVRDK